MTTFLPKNWKNAGDGDMTAVGKRSRRLRAVKLKNMGKKATLGVLAAAARAGNIKKLSELLKTASDVDINGCATRGGLGYPLAAAVEHHQLEAARLLLDAGARVSAGEYRAYRIAAYAKDEAAIRLLARYPSSEKRSSTVSFRDIRKIADHCGPAAAPKYEVPRVRIRRVNEIPTTPADLLAMGLGMDREGCDYAACACGAITLAASPVVDGRHQCGECRRRLKERQSPDSCN